MTSTTVHDPASLATYERIRDGLGVHRVVQPRRRNEHTHVVRCATTDEARRVAAFLLHPSEPRVALATVHDTDVLIVPA